VLRSASTITNSRPPSFYVLIPKSIRVFYPVGKHVGFEYEFVDVPRQELFSPLIIGKLPLGCQKGRLTIAKHIIGKQLRMARIAVFTDLA
jgi:hypothetical protein